MANHKSALKRIRQTKTRRAHNHYYAKSTRTAIKQFRSTEKKEEAEGMLPKLMSRIDKLAKKNIIHKNKASNLKSSLMRQLNSLS